MEQRLPAGGMMGPADGAVNVARTGSDRLAGALRYLLDDDWELAEGLDVPMRLAARRVATAVVFEVDPGELVLHRRLDAIGRGHRR
jgi:hypothetical protein